MPTGSVAGAVRDQSGAAVAAAHVKLQNAATGLIREVTTSTEGDYSFPALPTGEYEVSVEATGFRNIRRAASVEAGSTTAADFVLGVGEAKDSVTVDGASPQMNYDSHAVGGVINSRRIQELRTAQRCALFWNWRSLNRAYSLQPVPATTDC